MCKLHFSYQCLTGWQYMKDIHIRLCMYDPSKLRGIQTGAAPFVNTIDDVTGEKSGSLHYHEIFNPKIVILQVLITTFDCNPEILRSIPGLVDVLSVTVIFERD